MKSIKKFLKKNRIIFMVIGVCLLANSFLLYNQGIQRETILNKVYIDFITAYPKSIESVRVEPLFIVITYYFSKLLNPLLAIALLRLLITGIQLFIFYKITNLLTKNKDISVAFTVILNFSLTFVFLYNNLLRNHFANMLFLAAFFYLILILQNKTKIISYKNTLLASLFGGLLIYSHILPTILFNALLVIIFILFIVLSRVKLPRLQKQESLMIAKNFFLVGIFTFILQLPYILRFYNSNVTTDDYHQAGEIVNDKLFSFIDLLRVLFEFRLPGISIVFILFVAVSIFYLLKNLTAPRVLLLALWLLTYFCTKLDLMFGITVLPYRFSLMLIFSSLLLLSILFTFFISFIKNKKGKHFFVIIVIVSFLATNLPTILHTMIFRNLIPNYHKQELFQQIYPEIVSQTSKSPVVFAINGESFEKIDKESKYLRNDNFFTSFDENEIISTYNRHHVDFVIFDHFRINEKGTDINSVVNTNLSFYESSKHFQKIDEIVNPYIHISIFKFTPHTIATNNFSNISFDCSSDNHCQQKFEKYLENISPEDLNNWVIEITTSNNTTTITEFVHTTDKLISLTYTQKSTSKNDKQRIVLKNISARKNIAASLLIHIPEAKVVSSHTGFTINRTELQKLGVNRLTIFGNITNNVIEYSYLNTSQINRFISLMAIVVLFIYYLYLRFFRKNKSILQFNTAKERRLIIFIIFLIIADMLFLNALFINIYKSILHI